MHLDLGVSVDVCNCKKLTFFSHTTWLPWVPYKQAADKKPLKAWVSTYAEANSALDEESL
jgi:hypothetical protein